MKQGKVFDKLQARKNVVSITFQDKTCTVTLTDGRQAICGTAHEARLFIEGKQEPSVVHTKAAPIEVPVETPAATEKCGTDARYVTLDAAWVRAHAGDLCTIPNGARQVRVEVTQAAALIAGSAF